MTATIKDLAIDVELTPAQLSAKYNPHGEGEHPTFSRLEWISEVGLQNTLLGYWDWLESMIMAYHEDEGL